MIKCHRFSGLRMQPNFICAPILWQTILQFLGQKMCTFYFICVWKIQFKCVWVCVCIRQAPSTTWMQQINWYAIPNCNSLGLLFVGNSYIFRSIFQSLSLHLCCSHSQFWVGNTLWRKLPTILTERWNPCHDVLMIALNKHCSIN